MKTSEKSTCESSSRKSKKHHTDVEEQEGVYLQKTNKTLNRSQCVTSSPTFSEQGSGIVSLSATNLAEILIWSPCSSQISMESLRASTVYRNPREIKIQKFFTTLIRNTDSPTCKLFFNSGTFILTKLGSISLTEIVLKIVFVNNIKLQLHSYFGAKDFTPHKPHSRALFFARARVTGNTKHDYSSW